MKGGAAEQAIDDLRWLGLDWDEGPVYQSPRAGVYRGWVEKLLAEGQAYPCVCTRREIEQAASAPHAEDGAAVYPGTCRGRFASVEAATAAFGRPPAIRFRVPVGMIRWVDGVRGAMSSNPADELGDFVILKNDGTAAYQLAVVADDVEAGVTHVVRGDDLIDSTPRQILLYRALGFEAVIPQYFHLPLIVGPDGRRLAKRHGDTRLSYYRSLGIPAGRVMALLARWCGFGACDDIAARTLIEDFDVGRMATSAIAFTAADDAWLRGESHAGIQS